MTSAGRVAFLGLLAGLGLFVVLAVVSPDNGPGLTSLAQGLGVGAMVVAAPIAVLMSDRIPSTIVALGGGMTIAGAATTPGGNVAGLVMAVGGFALLFTGASARSPLDWRLVGSTVGYAIVLVIGTYAGLAPGLGTFISLILATAVATSPRWVPTQSAGR
jgi:hypothetical protein